MNQSHLKLPVVPVISESTLSNVSMDSSTVGRGRFGYCTKMTYKDMFIVCVKRMEKALVSLQALKSEAAILYSMNSAGFTPHCFGVCTEYHALVMSYIHVDMYGGHKKHNSIKSGMYTTTCASL